MYQRKNTNGHNSNSTNNNNNNNMYSRASSGGFGRDLEGGRGGGGRFNDTNANILEQQNNDRINELSDQVARLKVLTYIKNLPLFLPDRSHSHTLFLMLLVLFLFLKLGSND
jgi:hypothetical protein